MTALTVADSTHQHSWIFWLGLIICLSVALISPALNFFAVQWLAIPTSMGVGGIDCHSITIQLDCLSYKLCRF
jgi:hypothetical protein